MAPAYVTPAARISLSNTHPEGTLHTLPLSFLLSGSDEQLEGLELRTLAHASSLEKEARQISREAERLRVNAEVMRFLRLHRQSLLSPPAAGLAVLERAPEKRKPLTAG